MDKIYDITQYKTAGFFRRLLARFLDDAIAMLFAFAFSFSGLALMGKPARAAFFTITDPASWGVILVILMFLIFSTVLVFCYSWFFTHKFGGTPGKLLFGMRIVDDEGKFMDRATAFWRITAGYAASSTFFYLGYWWIFRKGENLAWHDRLFGTRVVRVGKPIGGIIALLAIPVITIVLLIQLIVPMFSVSL